MAHATADEEHQCIDAMGNNDDEINEMSAEIFHDSQQQSDTLHNSRQLRYRLIYITVVILYLALPSVSSAIFDASICKAFNTSDEEGVTRSYLVADWSIRCDSNNNEFNSLSIIFWVTFTIWPILVPLVFFGLLMSIRKSVYSNRTTFLSEAYRFLWRDYKQSMLFWDILDIYRKLFLVGLVSFVDEETGSNKILRLVIAIVVSAVYLGILALARPYEQTNDLHLAFTSNVILICFFSTGIIMHVCQDDESCKRYIDDSLTSSMATLLAVILTACMLLITMIFIGYIIISSINAPTIRIVSTGNRPNVEIPSNCQNHIFLSHIWGTGQEKVHNLVRMIQLYLPEARVWLDVDNLEDITKLEESVKGSAVFILFYTDGYFASENCRREVYAAIAEKKPIVTVYVNDSDIENMKTECHGCCIEDQISSDVILEKVMANKPILWLGNKRKCLSLASIKLFVLSLLHHLPYYQKNPEQLTRGLRIGKAPDPVRITSPLVIYTCHANGRAKLIAQAIKNKAKCDIQLRDTSQFLANDTLQNIDPNYQCEVLLLYLNKDLFKDPNGEVSRLVKLSLEKKIKPVLVFEQDAAEGACEFPVFHSQLPDELREYGLFNELAIPLYTIPEYRAVSLCLLVSKMSDICLSAQSK